MKVISLDENNIVVEIRGHTLSNPVIRIMEAPNEVQLGWVLNDGVFQPNLPQKKASEYPSVNEMIEALWRFVVNEEPTRKDSVETIRQDYFTRYPEDKSA